MSNMPLKNVNATSIDDLSPIDRKLRNLNEVLSVAHEGMLLLYEKLSPVRAVCPIGSAGDETKRPAESCEVEEKLQALTESAIRLSRSISELRGELRI